MGLVIPFVYIGVVITATANRLGLDPKGAANPEPHNTGLKFFILLAITVAFAPNIAKYGPVILRAPS